MAHTRRMALRGQAGPKRLPRHLRNEDLPTDTFTPRTYQVELLDSALRQNTIVCMSSGSGKTFIAVMLMKELAHEVRKPLAEGGKRSFYLVNSAVLVEQQAQAIQHPSDLTVGQYSTNHNLASWSFDQWSSDIDSHQVLVMMSETFMELLQQNIVHLGQVNLIVMDDCHLILQDNPYQRIMDLYRSCPDSQKPRILGLTNSVLNSHFRNPETLESMITSLENMLCSVAETSTLVISERYGIKPDEQIIECDDFDGSSELCEEMSDILVDAIYFLDECNVEITEELDNRDPKQIPRAALVECHNIMYQLGPWCAACIADMLVGQIEKIEKQKEFVTFHKKFLKFGATTLRMVSKVFEEHFKNVEYSVEELLSYSTPKVSKLVNSFRKYRPETDFIIISEELSNMFDSDSEMSDVDNDSDFSPNDDDDDDDDKLRSPKQVHVAVKKLPASDDKLFDPLASEEERFLCGVVFVEQQHTAYALSKFIEEVCAWDETLCFVKCSHITGHTVRSARNKETKIYRKQEELLRKFRMQELNLLVSTSVLEEGVDIPKCNLIVRFDMPKDYRSYSHSKGRARARGAEFIILVEEENYDEFESQLRMYKNIERVLINHTKKEEEVFEDGSGDDLLPPYLPTSEEGRAHVSLANAISLVNRYCAKLPSDAFTHLTPTCHLIEVTEGDSEKYVATLRLPINSPIKEEIKGVPMATKLLAKKAVALKMCEILHKRGELDEYLMPVGKEMFQQEEEDTEWEEEEESVGGEARPGTTKRKQYYYKKVASALVKSHPVSSQPTNLYVVNMKLTGPITDEQNTRGRKIYAPEDSTRCFGILTSNSIPLVPYFPVYTRSGEVTVSLDLLRSNMCWTLEELERLKLFHRFLFSNVLRLEKDPMDFSPEDAAVGYLLLPLNSQDNCDLNIDWEFCDKVEHSLTMKKPGTCERVEESFQFNREVYEDAVVMPSYRNIDQPQHFYVAEIRYDLNPLSPFPSPELYKTFCAYYTTKYGLSISNMDQPLLDVDHTSARLNLLIPRYMNQKGVALPTSSAETKKARRENLQQKQILVPELCDVHVFPASLWRKAVCLPAILYRMNYLLLAEEIRKNVATETKIGVINLPEGYRFPQLDFGFDTSPEKLKNLASETDEKKKNEEEKAAEDGDTSSEDDLSNEDPENKHEVFSDKEEIGCGDKNLLTNSSQTSDVQRTLLLEENSDVQTKSSSVADITVSETFVSIKQQQETMHADKESTDVPSETRAACQVDEITAHLSKIKFSGNTLCNGCSDRASKDVNLTLSVSDSTKDLKQSNNIIREGKSKILHEKSAIGNEDLTAHMEGQIGSFSCSTGTFCKQYDGNCDLCPVLSHKNGCLHHFSSNLNESNSCTKPFTDDTYSTSDEPVGSMGEDKLNNRNNRNKKVILETGVVVEDLGDAGSDNEVSKTDTTVTKQTISEEGLFSDLKDLSVCIEPAGSVEGSGWGEENVTPIVTENQSHAEVTEWCKEQSQTRGKDVVVCIDHTEETELEERYSVNMSDAETKEEISSDVFQNVSHFTTGIQRGVEEDENVSAVHQISLDEDIDLTTYIGPSPCTVLQALTMSNANDFFSLERLETIGDSFLKYAITVYLYCSYPGIHEGKLSYLRSKQVSNYNLYRLGKKKGLAECMISTKFEPYENWLPPGFVINEDKKKGPVPKVVIVTPLGNSSPTIFSGRLHSNPSSANSLDKMSDNQSAAIVDTEMKKFSKELEEAVKIVKAAEVENSDESELAFTPYSLQVHHSIPDKSIADGIEALIGCYLTSCGKMAALRFMSWLGLKVLPRNETDNKAAVEEGQDNTEEDFESLSCPQSPLLVQFTDADQVLTNLLDCYDSFEAKIGYTFQDRSYLLQAFTHASYHYNTVTDCYQRLEFLGDAILDYVITRHLYEDSCKYSPGVLTDLRSSLVNNNIFAALAVKWDFHKYFKAISPALFRVIEKFVARQKEREDEIDLEDEESGDDDQTKEHVELEVPKALGDIFESVAGAIYLDSRMSLDVVWRVYYRIMRPQINKYLKSIPKSPVRELLEMEPETAKFEKPERMMDGKIRVVVNVVGKGAFTGVGRNYRIAKSAAAKKALRSIKNLQLQGLI